MLTAAFVVEFYKQRGPASRNVMSNEIFNMKMIDSKAQYYSFVKMISEHSLLVMSGSRERGRTRYREAATSPSEGDTGTGIGPASDQIVTGRAKHKESYDENIAAHRDFCSAGAVELGRGSGPALYGIDEAEISGRSDCCGGRRERLSFGNLRSIRCNVSKYCKPRALQHLL